MDQGPGLAAEEAISPIVEGVPELHAATLGLDRPGPGIEAEVVAVETQRLCIGLLDGPDHPTVAGRGTIDLVVQPPLQVVEHRLLVLRPEARKDALANVCLVVSIGVLQI